MQLHQGTAPSHLPAHGPALYRHVVHLQRRLTQRKRFSTGALIHLLTCTREAMNAPPWESITSAGVLGDHVLCGLPKPAASESLLTIHSQKGQCVLTQGRPFWKPGMPPSADGGVAPPRAPPVRLPSLDQCPRAQAAAAIQRCQVHSPPQALSHDTTFSAPFTGARA